MNILNRLPYDLQEMIYKINHKDFMKTLQNNLWNKLRDAQQEYYIATKYPTEYASYCIYTEWDTLQNPDDVAINGKCVVLQSYDDDLHSEIYVSNDLENPSYGDILLEADNVISITDDNHRIFLEGFNTYYCTDGGFTIIQLHIVS